MSRHFNFVNTNHPMGLHLSHKTHLNFWPNTDWTINRKRSGVEKYAYAQGEAETEEKKRNVVESKLE